MSLIEKSKNAKVPISIWNKRNELAKVLNITTKDAFLVHDIILGEIRMRKQKGRGKNKIEVELKWP